MRRFTALAAFLILAGSSSVALADVVGPPSGMDENEVGLPTVEAPAEEAKPEAEAAPAADDKKADEAKADESKGDEKKADEKKADEKKADEKKADEKSGSCSVETEDNALFGLTALVMLFSGAALRRRRNS